MVEGKPDNSKDQPSAIGHDATSDVPVEREAEFIEQTELAGRDVDPTEPASPVDAEPAPAVAADREAPAERATPRASPILPLLSGAIGAAAVLGAAWFTVGQNLVPPQRGDSAALDALSARLASVEGKADAAASAVANAGSSAPASTATAAPAEPDAGVTRRLDALEKTIASLRDDISAASERSAQLSAAVNALKLAPAAGEAPAGDASAAAPATDFTEVNAKLAQLEAALKALPPAPPAVDLAPINDRLAKLDAAVAKPPTFDDTTLRRVVAAMLLDSAVRQGEAYGPLLEIAKPLGKDELKPLEVFATTGVPSATALCRELIALLPKLIPGYDPLDSTASIVDRLQAGADRLVRIQRPGSGGSRDRSVVLARMIAAAHRNELAEAQRELSSLDPSERIAAQGWLDRANARDAALAASQKFAAAALAALPKTSP